MDVAAVLIPSCSLSPVLEVGIVLLVGDWLKCSPVPTAQDLAAGSSLH